MEIEALTFGVFSENEIRRMAVCEITNTKLDGPGSVYDERMGPRSNSNYDKCISCNRGIEECSGHFGMIVLPIPIVHPMYISIAANFLRLFCHSCSKLVVSEQHLDLSGYLSYFGKDRFKLILEKLKKIEAYDICYHCKKQRVKIIYSPQEEVFYQQLPKITTRTILSDINIKRIFDSVLDDDVRLIGLDPRLIHPRNLLISCFPVLPSIDRPCVSAESGGGEAICDDDLTIQYLECIKSVNHLIAGGNVEFCEKHLRNIKFRIKTTLNNGQGKARHSSSGRVIQSIKQRISGKQGIIRAHLLGKRSDQSARSVLGPDACIETDQIVIPEYVATSLSMPERVTDYNKKYLTRLILNNKANIVRRDKYKIHLQYNLRVHTKKLYRLCRGDKIKRGSSIIDPGNIIISTSNLEYIPIVLKSGDILLRFNGIEEHYIEPDLNKNFELQIGDIVQRHLQDGDIAVMNRQPTLHLGSMIAMRVLVRPGSTFRVQLAVTKSINGDFDGDTISFFAPQDYQARAELDNLCRTEDIFVTPQASKPNIVIVQDNMLGIYLMTRENQSIPKHIFFDMCMMIKINKKSIDVIASLNYIFSILSASKNLIPAKKSVPLRDGTAIEISKKNNDKNLTGSILLSLLFPQTFMYTCKDGNLQIVKGTIVCGYIAKRSINIILHHLYKEYGKEYAIEFINNVQFVTNSFLLWRGFTVGLQDCIIDNQAEIRSTIAQSLLQASDGQEYTERSGKRASRFSNKIREAKVVRAINRVKDFGMKIAKDSMNIDNAFVSTVTSGSKGDFFNIAQICGLLGQQNVNARRIQPTIDYHRRTLPHYIRGEGDTNFESRGFIQSSFIKGLNPREFFFHAISGREGLISTSISTSTTGYTQRKIVKMLEDVTVAYDGTVRSAAGNILQWAYGDDGLDRKNTIIKNNVSHVCDIQRLADQLNCEYERNQ